MEPAHGKMKSKTLVVSTAAIIAVELLLSSLFRHISIPRYPAICIVRLFQILSVFAIVIYFQKNLASMGLSRKDTLKGILRGVIWSGAIGVITIACFLLLYFAGTNPFTLFRSPLPQHTIDIVFYFIAGGIAAPLAEEVYFRGVFYSFLRPQGFYYALAVSTVFFAVAHMIFSGTGFPVTQIAGGIIFGWAFEKEKNLLVPIVIHSTGNVALFTLSLL